MNAMEKRLGGGFLSKAIGLIIATLAMALALGVFVPQTAHAEDWGTYLSRMWQGCEDTFAALDKESGVTPWDGTAVQPAVGDGTAANPYQVGTASELRWVMNQAATANKSFTLTADIDLGGLQNRIWTGTQVTGTQEVVMDGNGHTIYNMKMSGAGGGSNGAGVGFVAYCMNPSFTMKDLTFKYCEVRSTATNYNYAVAVAYLGRGSLLNVGVEDSIVKGGNFAAGLAVGWDTGQKAVDGQGNPVTTWGSRIDRCHTVRVYTYGASCIGNFCAPLMGGYVTNSYAVDGVSVSTGGHSGGFISCPGYCYAENCFCNITMYGNTQTGVFCGVNHFNNGYKNCGASGVVEGTTQVGGFLGDGTRGTSTAYASQYTNCYSTTMVGMQSSASYMGGFVGSADGNLTFRNCYAAGEVGALTTDGNANSVGGFIGNSASANIADCYYDKQTSSLKEFGVGIGNAVLASGGTATVTGKITKDITGSDALSRLPGFDSSVWVAKDGVYPQLKTLNQPDTFAAPDRNIMTAYSMASVCTAMLYPSNGDYPDETSYDTVRSITYLFPFTNNAMAKDSHFDISWVADDDKSTVPGMETIPVITLKKDGSYAVASLAPGVGWTTVYVDYTPDPSNPAVHEVGKRRLRLVPTTTLSVATSAGVDHTAYVAPATARPLDPAKHAGFMTYDHRDGVKFSKGTAVDLAGGKLNTEAFPADSESFSGVVLNTVKGTVDVSVAKQNTKGEWEDLELTDSLKQLLLKKRNAEYADLGKYRMTYKWYANGAGGAYLESTKYLDVVETFNITYYRNDEDLEQPTNAKTKANASPVAQAAFQPRVRLAAAASPATTNSARLMTAAAASPEAAGPTTYAAQRAAAYYYDPGAYAPGDTVDPNYYPGSASADKANPETDGYDFKGWSTEQEDGTVDFTDSTPINKNMVVYGVWDLKNLDVTFNMNGGSFDGSEDAVVEHFKALDTMTTPDTKDNKPVRDGYSFMGWAESPTATKADFDSEEQLWNENKTYYAVWLPNPQEKVTVKVENITDAEHDTVQVGDTLKNTITAENEAPADSIWKDAVVSTVIPEGLTPKDGTIVLKTPDGTEKKIPLDEVYDPDTRTLTVPVGDIPGGKESVLVFETEVNPKALEEDEDISLPIDVDGKNPDGDPRPQIKDEGTPVGADDVLPDDGEPSIVKSVTNKTRGDKQDALVGDTLAYTIELSNTQAASLLEGATITDVLPEGITLVPGTLKLVNVGGAIQVLDEADVYDSDTRAITVPVGDLTYGQKVKLTFDAVINQAAVDPANIPAHNIGNVASVTGSSPENEPIGPEDSVPVFPSGWVKYVTPDPYVEMTVDNETHKDGFYEEDRLTYTIEVGNKMVGSTWKNVEVTNKIPDGLTYVKGSLKLVRPDGTVEPLADSFYDESTRTLVVPIAAVEGGKNWKVIYEAVLGRTSDGKPIVNEASVTGDGFFEGDVVTGADSIEVPYPDPAPKGLAGRLPQTGDSAGVLVVGAMAMMAAAVIVMSHLRRKRA